MKSAHNIKFIFPLLVLLILLQLFEPRRKGTPVLRCDKRPDVDKPRSCNAQNSWQRWVPLYPKYSTLVSLPNPQIGKIKTYMQIRQRFPRPLQNPLQIPANTIPYIDTMARFICRPGTDVLPITIPADSVPGCSTNTVLHTMEQFDCYGGWRGVDGVDADDSVVRVQHDESRNEPERVLGCDGERNKEASIVAWRTDQNDQTPFA
jgi:hypothetical protein